MKKLVFSLILFGGMTVNAQQLLEVLKPHITNTFTPSEKCLERVYDRNYGDGIHNFIYCAVQGPKGKKWLNHNLGAEYTREPTSDNPNPDFNPEAVPTDYNDWKAFGSIFQYARPADGHELVEYRKGTTYWEVKFKNGVRTTQLATGEISNQTVINSEDYHQDNNQLKSGWPINGENNPCPFGYHVMRDEDLLFTVLLVNIEGGKQTSSIATLKYRGEETQTKIITSPILSTKNLVEDNQWYKSITYLNDPVNGGGGTSQLWAGNITRHYVYRTGNVAPWNIFWNDLGRVVLDRGFWGDNNRYYEYSLSFINKGINRNSGVIDAAIRCVED